ncbi:MAG: enoyl-CoA hydratase/isomerase family protein [Candidatus Zixiibacteriota bacterium]|nr:MAG: enoyl-CoA hydratase/isomerase family protein [candidate division Zixibacteria bacterium]
MSFINVSQEKDITTVTLTRGKVNAINESLVDELHAILKNLEDDPQARAVVLTGAGKFFSFGLDIPELYSYSQNDFLKFLQKFTNLYTSLFLFPKPVVAAINGHAIAGGCMLATPCDFRIMTTGKPRISLNEVTFGSSVFAGSVSILKFCVGAKNAAKILYSGSMFSAEEAHQMSLVDEISTESDLAKKAMTKATELAGKDSAAFGSIKRLLRRPVADEMSHYEQDSLREFVEIWYSKSTREQTKKIEIYS